MKWLKDNPLLIVIVAAICGTIVYMGQCSSKQEFADLKKEFKDSAAALKKVVDESAKLRRDLTASIKGYNDSMDKQLKEIAGRQTDKEEAKKKIGKIPTEKVFADLKKCNTGFAGAQATAKAQGEYIIILEAEIKNYEQFVLYSDKKEKAWIDKEKIYINESAAYKTKTERDEKIINDLMKSRQSMVAVTAGAYYDPLKGKGGVAIGIGINLTSLLKKLL